MVVSHHAECMAEELGAHTRGRIAWAALVEVKGALASSRAHEEAVAAAMKRRESMAEDKRLLGTMYE